MTKYFILPLAILYFIFLAINVEMIEDKKGVKWKAGLTEIVGEGPVDAINSFQDFTADYRESLHEEADFGKMSFDEVSKEDFKRPYLFWIFLKDIFVTLLKIIALLFLIKLLIKQVIIIKDTLQLRSSSK